MLEFEVKNKKIRVSRFRNTVSIQGNNNTDFIVFILDKVQGVIDLELYQSVIKVKDSKGRIDVIYPEIVIDNNLIYLKWKITNATTYMSGFLDIQIEFYDISEINNIPIWQSEISQINIQTAIRINDSITQDVSAFYEWEKRLNDIKEQVYLRLDASDIEHNEITNKFQEISEMTQKLKEFYEDIMPHLTGDAITLQGRIVDNTKVGDKYLWTSEKITQEDDKLTNKILQQVSSNATSLQGRTIDDNKIGTNYLWTSGKVNLELTQKSNSLMGNVIYYVSTNGSDSNNGSESNKFKTINKALSKIPRNLNGYNVTIRVEDGIYTESINVSKFYGSGQLTIVGNTINPRQVKVQWGRMADISSIVVFDGMEFVSNNSNISIYVEGCSKVFLKNCYFDGIDKNNNLIGVLARASSLSIYNCDLNNFATAIMSQAGISSTGVAYFSMVYILVQSCKGKGNTIGFEAVGGMIADSVNNTITAVLRYSTQDAGVIIKGKGGFIG